MFLEINYKRGYIMLIRSKKVWSSSQFLPLTIEVEDTFDVGDLPQIKPNRQYKTKEEELEYALKRISNV